MFYLVEGFYREGSGHQMGSKTKKVIDLCHVFKNKCSINEHKPLWTNLNILNIDRNETGRFGACKCC